MIWNMDGRGFLPNPDPLISLPITDYKTTELVYTWENLAHIVPHYLKEECLREEIIYALRKADASYYHGFVDSFASSKAFERTFLILAYFATAYVNSPEGRRKAKLPKEITIPFSRAAHLVSRQPVLDYAAYCLYNWKKIKPSEDIIAGNVEPMLTFTDTQEEKLLISTMVEAEYLVGSILSSWHNPSYVTERLNHINKLIKKTWDAISKSFLRQFFQDFDNLTYEGWNPGKHFYSCDILLQSPILACFCKYLDIRFKNDYLRRCSEMFSGHRPQLHINYMQGIQPIKAKCANDLKLKNLYNDCLMEVSALYENLAFRASKEEVQAAKDELRFFII